MTTIDLNLPVVTEAAASSESHDNQDDGSSIFVTSAQVRTSGRRSSRKGAAAGSRIKIVDEDGIQVSLLNYFLVLVKAT